MAIEVDTQSELFTFLIGLLVSSLFVHLAAGMVLDRSRFLQALLTAFLGSLVAGLCVVFIGGTLGWVLAAAAWALVAALFYRTGWVKGAIIGLVAFVLWVLVRLAYEWFTQNVKFT